MIKHKIQNEEIIEICDYLLKIPFDGYLNKSIAKAEKLKSFLEAELIFSVNNTLRPTLDTLIEALKNSNDYLEASNNSQYISIYVSNYLGLNNKLT